MRVTADGDISHHQYWDLDYADKVFTEDPLLDRMDYLLGSL